MSSELDLSPKALVAPVLWLSGFILTFYFLPFDNMPQTAGAFSALAVLAGWIVYRKPLRITLTPLTYLIAALWGWAFVTAMASEVKFIGLLYVFFFGVFPLGTLVFSSCDEGRKILPWARLLILGVGINSVYQFYFDPQALKFGGTHWPFADNNSLGAMLAAGALLFFGEALRGGKSIWLNLVAALILVAGIISTEGRAIMIVFGAMTLLLVGLEISKSKITHNWKVALVFVAGILLLLGVMTKSDLSMAHWLTDGSQTMASFENTSSEKPDRLSGSRFMMWKSSARMFENHPFLGSGIGTFYLYYPEYRSPYDDSLGLMAHNDLVQFAVEMGFMGPLLALSIIGFVVVRTTKVYLTAKDQQTHLDVLIPACVFLMICGHSLVNFNFYVLPSLMLNGLILGTWNRAVGQASLKTIGNNDSRRQAVALIIVLLLICNAVSITGSEYYTNKSSDSLGKENAAEFAKYLEYADMLGMGLNGRVYYQAARFAAETDDKDRSLILLDRAESVNPRIAGIYHQRSLLVEDKATAMEQAEKALRIDPASIQARMNVANLWESAGDRRKAYDILKVGMIGMMRSSNPLPYYERVEKMAKEFGDSETLEKVRKEIARRTKK